MAQKVHVYMCTNGACRHIEKRGGMKKATLGKCPYCKKGSLNYQLSE